MALTDLCMCFVYLNFILLIDAAVDVDSLQSIFWGEKSEWGIDYFFQIQVAFKSFPSLTNSTKFLNREHYPIPFED